MFIDHQTVPVINCPVKDFFSDNPFTAYPFVFGTDRTYPGFLLPIPFREHIKIQLWSKDEFPAFQNWGNYWQVTYTQYAPGVPVRSFSLPLTPEEKIQMKKTGDYWIRAEKGHFTEPAKWERSATLNVKIGVERWNVFSADDQQKCVWGSTAYWYAEYPVPAGSEQHLPASLLPGDEAALKEGGQ